jgi:hypothetical protein
MKTYPLTPEQFNALKTKLIQMGVQLEDGNDGEIAYKGIKLKYRYWPPDSMRSGSLTLTILEKPFLISQGLIWGKVDEWLGLASS